MLAFAVRPNEYDDVIVRAPALFHTSRNPSKPRRRLGSD